MLVFLRTAVLAAYLLKIFSALCGWRRTPTAIGCALALASALVAPFWSTARAQINLDLLYSKPTEKTERRPLFETSQEKVYTDCTNRYQRRLEENAKISKALLSTACELQSLYDEDLRKFYAPLRECLISRGVLQKDQRSAALASERCEHDERQKCIFQNLKRAENDLAARIVNMSCSTLLDLSATPSDSFRIALCNLREAVGQKTEMGVRVAFVACKKSRAASKP